MTYSRKYISTPLATFCRVVSPRRVGVAAAWSTLALLVILTGQTVREMISRLPPPPPTPAQSAAALPGATRDWRVVSTRLQARFSDKPLELGEVWATRTGRMCGFVTARKSNTDDRERFYATPDLRPHMQVDDPYAFIDVWTACLDDRWVELHAGSEQTGLCASPRGRSSVLARTYLCVGWTPE